MTMPKIAVLIDGANVYHTGKKLDFQIDYAKLLKYFRSEGTLVRAFYYTAVIETEEFCAIQPLLDFIDYNGYSVVTKASKEFMGDDGVRKIKGNMDVEIAVDALEICQFVDIIYLFTGDGDFRCLVEAIQRKGVVVKVVSSIVMRPPMIADELRRQADEFIDLASLKPIIAQNRR